MKKIWPFVIVVIMAASMLWAQDTTRSHREALQQLIADSKTGNPKAIFNLARLYETGYDSIPQDSVLSLALFFKAASLNYPPAMNIIGFRYHNGSGVKQDSDSAFYWITKAAEAGDPTAFSNLGYLYALDKDFINAEKWLEKAVETGVPSAMSQLGDIKKLGLTSPPDTIAAAMLYDAAIEAGDWDSQYKQLGMMGYKWQQLHGDEALKLGLKYYAGNAPVAGVELLEIAAREGEAQAMALLGDAYSRGIGVEYNPPLSLEYFHKAAISGYAPAQFLIAELLDFYPDEFEESAEDFRSAALSSGISDADTAYSLIFTLP